MSTKQRFILLIPVLALSSCRPVIAIGWDELLLLFVIFVVLFGVPVFRMLRHFADFMKSRNRKKGK